MATATRSEQLKIKKAPCCQPLTKREQLRPRKWEIYASNAWYLNWSNGNVNNNNKNNNNYVRAVCEYWFIDYQGGKRKKDC